MKLEKPQNPAGEFWGGLAAMLVALPSAIAFGVTIFSPLGSSYVAQGALAGILGTTALGLLAPLFGGTNRLITAPCAPAAAVLAALALTLTQKGIAPDAAVIMLAMVALFCGALQILFGAVKAGRLIKYMPYPVVSGYLTGVGLIIIIGQVPRLLGVPKGTHFWQSVLSPSLWNWQGIIVGVVTAAVMLTATRVTKAIPAAILGLAAGVLTYFALGLRDHSLWTLAGNKLVVGPIVTSGGGFAAGLAARWRAVAGLRVADLEMLITPALTLSVLLSIDTLKTCVVLDALTRTRHNSNRELVGQGVANLGATLIGGVPGAGQMGATLVNISSGGQTRWSGVIEGALALVAFLLLSNLVAWVPIAALAGILIVIGFRMFDRHSLHLLKSKATILDFVVIVAVVVVAETISLIAASAVGVGLAIMLFIREQVGGSIVRRKAYGNQMFSKQVRLPPEMAVLEKRGDRTAIYELQGSLFFGTTDQLYTALEADLKTRTYIILDLRRVQSVDFTAAHMLELIEGMLSERKSYLLFSCLPQNVPSGQDMRQYFDHLGLVRPERRVHTFNELDEALEWAEDRILEEEFRERALQKALELREIDLFQARKEETLAALEACMDKHSYKAGEVIFRHGDQGDTLFLIRRGLVRLQLPLNHGKGHHLATMARGDFFGEMSFLDNEPRSADAIAHTDVEVFILPRSRFNNLTEEHKRLAITLFEELARVLALRLRHTNAELRALQEG